MLTIRGVKIRLTYIIAGISLRLSNQMWPQMQTVTDVKQPDNLTHTNVQKEAISIYEHYMLK